ncbi:hypothetical protein ACFL0Q_07460 [Thermodesulfobacteriota bacterium]
MKSNLECVIGAAEFMDSWNPLSPWECVARYHDHIDASRKRTDFKVCVGVNLLSGYGATVLHGIHYRVE